jgi:hypothetical protein
VAASDAKPLAQKALAYADAIKIVDSVGAAVTTGTVTSQVSKDYGAFSSMTTTPTHIGNGWWKVELSSTEMTADIVIVHVVTTATNCLASGLTVRPWLVVEPSAAPAFATMGLEELAGWLLAQFRNKRTQTSTTTTLRNDADSADISTSTVSDDGTTFTAGKFT